MPKNLLLLALVPSALLLAPLWQYVSKPQDMAEAELVAASNKAPAQDTQQQDVSTERSIGTASIGRILFTSPDFVRSIEGFGPPFKMSLKTVVRNPVTNRTERWSRDFSVSFQPAGASGVTANEFVVFGYGRNDIPIFEYWTLPADSGTYYSYRVLPGTPVGVPVPLGSTTVEVSGDYTSPSKRDDLLPLMQRTVVYQGTGVDRVENFAVDPEGRFLLSASADTNKLYRVFITEDNAPELLYSEVSLPSLGDVQEIDVLFHQTQGLCWRITSPEYVDYLWDNNNDGIINSVESLTLEESWDEYPFGSFELL